MPLVKICGITNLKDALYSIEYGADAIGFIFSRESKRRITLPQAIRIIEKLPPFIVTVGVFVNEEVTKVMEVALNCNLTCLQFHGEESNTQVAQFRPMKLIKTIRIKNRESIDNIKNYEATVDAILLDTYKRGVYGGTGLPFNWQYAIEAKKYNKPIILAGGLTPDNVYEAIVKVNPYAVDTATGVEKEPGRKDLNKLKKFIQRAKGRE